MRWAVLDELIAAATTDAEDVLAARQEWSQHTGLVHADHELYSERSDAFVEWYVLERPGADGRTPAERVLRGGTLGEADEAVVRALCRSHRSLFQVHRLEGGVVTVNDLLGGGRFDVDERRRLPGVSAGDIFEARVVPDPDEPYRLVFARTFLFHPREAQRAVLDHVEKWRRQNESRTALLFRLQRLRLRCVSYKHVPAQRIYAQPDVPP